MPAERDAIEWYISSDRSWRLCGCPVVGRITPARSARVQLCGGFEMMKYAIATVAVAIALVAPGAGVTAASAAPAHHIVYVLSANGRPSVRPGYLYVHKNPGGAHGYWLSHLRWPTWNETSAFGRGHNLDSADRVTVSLNRPDRLSGRWVFTRMTIRSPASNHLGWTVHHLWWSPKHGDWEYH